jgi:hypothetical protein
MRRQSVVYLKDAGASIGFWVQGHLVVTSPPVAVIMPGFIGARAFLCCRISVRHRLFIKL